MSPGGIPWGALLTEALTMFLLLFGLGLSLIGVWTLWSQGHR
jgi:hypothetical protein